MVSVLVMVIVTSEARRQTPDFRPEKLVAELDSGSLAKRNQAERRLVAGGSRTIEWLDDPTRPLSTEELTSEVRHRLQRIRMQIFLDQLQSAKRASLLSVPAGLNARQLQAAIASQTGNEIVVETLDELQFDSIEEVPFWTFLDRLCQRNELSVNYELSGNGQITLQPVSGDGRANDGRSQVTAVASKGPLRLEYLTRREAGRENSPSAPRQIRLRLLWEPRMRLLGIRVPMKNVSVSDTNNESWARFNREAVLSVPASPARNMATFRLPLRRTSEGQAKALSLPVRITMLAPNATALFEDIGIIRHRQEIRFGMATITQGRTEINGSHLRIQIETRYDRDQMAQPLQSHQPWGEYCSAGLIAIDGDGDDDAGQRLSPVSRQQIHQSAYRYTIEYEFAIPQNSETGWNLAFSIPSGLVATEEMIEMQLDNLQQSTREIQAATNKK